MTSVGSIQGRPAPRVLPTIVYTGLALLAFAANSLLCRLALTNGGIDPASFTLARLASGAVMLALLVRSRRSGAPPPRRGWTGATLLFLYAAPFSFAYQHLPAGTGALLLFGAVQLTMLLASFRAGHAPSPAQWFGLALAFAGLTYLVLPGLTAPSPLGATLMLLAGVAWGCYTLHGRSAGEPLAETAANFTRSVPLAVVLCLAAFPARWPATSGFALAVLSGALASAIGYVLWYRALGGHSALSAGVVQLAVPVLAAGGGIAFLQERLTARLAIATLLVLSGIAVALLRPGKYPREVSQAP